MKRALKILALIIICTLFGSYASAQTKVNKEELKIEIENLYNNRSKVFINGDLSALQSYFDTSHKYGEWALEHEIKRVKYLKHWAYQRNIEFKDVKSSVILYKVYNTKKGVRLALKELYKFNYFYKNDSNPTINSFGVGIKHTVDLTKKNDKWVIFSDWYTDCFEDALKSYTGDITPWDFSKDEVFSIENCPKVINENYEGRYDRLKAIKYADKYCGASLDYNTDYKYNKKYKDYNGIGGDCTNFASQVLGDKDAGGLKFDGSWHCNYPKYGMAEGSKAFVNADAFRNYLLYSGKGKLIKRGDFKQLITPIEGYPCGSVQKLEPGDLICYAKGHDIDHFAIVTSWDSRGYPLINSHTTDRYHVPWDLGWGDKNIFFHLIHIR
ncbi:amidase domain-containing protein [Clostridium rectalis]|uniref:amidase domain-containing protein n=1 Tax=Clostridium rectalis TaxID=2040295 RepID=UPI000F62FFB3|nr:amidase domain-containing protein [Clostridium rectalis]